MNAIANLPVPTKDINLAEKTFEKDIGTLIGTLKGKSTRSKPPPVVTDIIEIPPWPCDARDQWELALDIVFVNGIPCMTSITKTLCYRTATPVPSVKDPQLCDAIDGVFRMCNDAGVTLTDVYADNQFAGIMDLGVTMHHPPTGGHVPEAERNIQVLKERIRASYHRVPYKALPLKL